MVIFVYLFTTDVEESMKKVMNLNPAVVLVALLAGFATASSSVVAAPNAAKAGSGKAIAVLEARSQSTVSGTARFKEKKDVVEVEIVVKGATPGLHGVHLHETGDCSAPDAKSAGGHFNPEKMAHGSPETMPHHAGDLGNIEVNAKGTGKLKLTLQGLTIAEGDHSVLGRAVVMHADPDDLKSQPAGNSGARIACGVIKAQEKSY
jgi:Cu-Zn family superoxide dismutase